MTALIWASSPPPPMLKPRIASPPCWPGGGLEVGDLALHEQLRRRHVAGHRRLVAAGRPAALREVLLRHRRLPHVGLAEDDEVPAPLQGVGQDRAPGVRQLERPRVPGVVLKLGDRDAEAKPARRGVRGGGGTVRADKGGHAGEDEGEEGNFLHGCAGFWSWTGGVPVAATGWGGLCNPLPDRQLPAVSNGPLIARIRPDWQEIPRPARLSSRAGSRAAAPPRSRSGPSQFPRSIGLRSLCAWRIAACTAPSSADTGVDRRRGRLLVPGRRSGGCPGAIQRLVVQEQRTGGATNARQSLPWLASSCAVISPRRRRSASRAACRSLCDSARARPVSR